MNVQNVQKHLALPQIYYRQNASEKYYNIFISQKITWLPIKTYFVFF